MAKQGTSTKWQAPALTRDKETDLTIIPEELLAGPLNKAHAQAAVDHLVEVTRERDEAEAELDKLRKQVAALNRKLTEAKGTTKHNRARAQSAEVGAQVLCDLLGLHDISAKASWYGDDFSVMLRIKQLEFRYFVGFRAGDKPRLAASELQVYCTPESPIQLSEIMATLHETDGRLNGSVIAQITAAMANVTPEKFQEHLRGLPFETFASIYDTVHHELYKLVEIVVNEEDGEKGHELARNLYGLASIDLTALRAAIEVLYEELPSPKTSITE